MSFKFVRRGCMEQRRISAERQFVGRRTLRKGANTPGVEDLSTL